MPDEKIPVSRDDDPKRDKPKPDPVRSAQPGEKPPDAENDDSDDAFWDNVPL